jgi:preprotein translocase subunit SecD
VSLHLRRRWRVVLLVILLVLSGVALFNPGAGATTGPTSLDYGLELSGGTRLRAPVQGTTAHGVNVSGDAAGVQQTVADELEVDVTDVRVVPGSNAVEVYRNVSDAEFRAALDTAGYAAESIEPGVTDATRAAVVDTIQSKINAAGLSGGSVHQSRTATGRNFVVVEVPNANASSVRDLVNERGVVRIVARYPTSDGGNTTYQNTTALSQEEIASVGTASQYGRPPQPAVPVTLTDQGAQRFVQVMRENGFTTQQGTDSCRYRSNPQNPGHCIMTVRDGEVVYAASMSGGPQGLAQDIESGAFLEDPTFIVTARNMSEARDLRIDLQAGALPAPLNVDGGTSYFLSPSLAEEFKLFSLITGLVAVLAVSVVVFLRYGEPWVAAPMVVTALSEVAILLGFAAAISLPLDLSHIAGFIAVIGTGVDDLIIIADEVMTEDVSSGRVFASRFRKALWVIGAAAITTIIAMSPLAILSLGDLRGFAIVTILGVLIGVLVTRPAYGDILRARLTEH